jgi:hypothetical protein
MYVFRNGASNSMKEGSVICSLHLTVLLTTQRHGPHRKHHSSAAVYGPLPSNGRCLVVCFVVVAKQRVYMPHFSLLKAICPKQLTGVPPFLLFRGLCSRRMWSAYPSFLWLIFHCDYSPTAPAGPPVRQFVLSGSLTRCEPVQVYHHPQSRVLLDPVHHIVYPVTTLHGPSHEDWSWGDFSFVWVGR